MENIKTCNFCGEEIKSVAIKCKHCGSMLSDEPTTGQTGIANPDTLVRQVLGDKYEIVGVAGSGGMAIVYKAIQKNLGRTVALKIIHQNLIHDHEFVSRFLREAQLSASLSHPNIVTVYDIGSIGQIHYMAMEYLEGEDLHQMVKKERVLNADKVVEWIIPIADSLDYIHKRGMLHRDVKSANIFITNGGRPVLMDFGIALAANGTKLTQAGSVMGTPEYMSPEQANGLGLTAQSDLWSLGVVLYDCLSGNVPFRSDNPLTTINMVINSQASALISLNNSVPVWLSAIVMKLLEKDPMLRFVSGQELSKALKEKIAPVISNKTGKPDREIKKPIGKANFKAANPIKWLPWAIGIVAVFILTVFIWMLIEKRTYKGDPMQKVENIQPKQDSTIDSNSRINPLVSQTPENSSLQAKKQEAQSNLERMQAKDLDDKKAGQEGKEVNNQEEFEEKVSSLIKEGDLFFTMRNFGKAIESYTSALAIIPEDEKIKSKINQAESEKKRIDRQKLNEEKTNAAPKVQVNIENGEDKIYTEAEEMPEFPGGDVARMRFLAENIKYPQQAREKGIQGAVHATIIVEPDGSISNISLTRTIGGGCDEEAIRLIKMMPKWNPGKMYGKPVRVKVNQSIRFTL